MRPDYAKLRDRRMARGRMRRLRRDGPTVHDRARNAAIVRLIAAHRDEFDEYVGDEVYRLRHDS